MRSGYTVNVGRSFGYTTKQVAEQMAKKSKAAGSVEKQSILARQTVKTKSFRANVSRRASVMQRVMLRQFLYFLTEAGFSRESLKADFDEIMALPPGTKPVTKAPLMPLESLHYGEILSAWNSSRDYTDSNGLPSVIPFSIRDARKPSFVRLCKAYNPSLSPKRILQELKRCGAVEQIAPNQLVMKMNYVRLNRNDRESAMYSLKVLADLLHTMTLNRKNRERPGLFQRVAWKETLDPDYLPQLELLVRENGLNFLEFIDDRMDENDLMRSKPTGASGAKKKKAVRVSVGVYISAG